MSAKEAIYKYWADIAKEENWGEDFEYPDEITLDNAEEVLQELDELQVIYLPELLEEFRSNYDEETDDFESGWSRHYEHKSVAKKCFDDVWVGWTYWYGGGKHGCPEDIPWLDKAYLLDVKEEEKMVIVRTFEKRQ